MLDRIASNVTITMAELTLHRPHRLSPTIMAHHASQALTLVNYQHTASSFHVELVMASTQATFKPTGDSVPIRGRVPDQAAWSGGTGEDSGPEQRISCRRHLGGS